MSEMRKITAGPHDQANWLMPMFDARRFDLLDANGDPVPGLYAIGNDSGRFFSDCYPELVVGVAAGRSLTFGYLLGKALAAQEA